jgi:uncharacterized protein YbaR (Trm112 family)
MKQPSITAKTDRLRRHLLPLLRCIRCEADGLKFSGAMLRCPSCAQVYRIHRGIPLMTYNPEAALAFGRGVVVENPYSGKWLELIHAAGDRPLLDLGSGNNPMPFEHVVKLDVFALPNVDVVGLAENLPFRSGVFKTVMSGAVFEHVMDPFLAIDQVHRVLAEDGDVYIETAFLQPVHAFPSHYYNMTRQGLANLCKSFEPLDSGVQPHQYPSFVLRWILEAWADKLPLDERKDFLSATVGDVIQEYTSNVFSKRWLAGFTAQDIEELACGVYFHGRRQSRRSPDARAHAEPEFRATPATAAERIRALLPGLRRRARRAAARWFA